MAWRVVIFNAGIVAALLVAVPRLSAHRLDEYLQATRLAVDVDRISVQLDLTPGAAVASSVIAILDVDRDGSISDAEARTYAAHVLASTVLAVDGVNRGATLTKISVPSIADMTAGVGTIRLEAAADVRVPAGSHTLRFANSHESAISVYLINALVPSDSRVALGVPDRDSRQREFTLQYSISGGWRPLSLSWSAVACLVALTVALAVCVRMSAS